MVQWYVEEEVSDSGYALGRTLAGAIRYIEDRYRDSLLREFRDEDVCGDTIRKVLRDLSEDVLNRASGVLGETVIDTIEPDIINYLSRADILLGGFFTGFDIEYLTVTFWLLGWGRKCGVPVHEVYNKEGFEILVYVMEGRHEFGYE